MSLWLRVGRGWAFMVIAAGVVTLIVMLWEMCREKERAGDDEIADTPDWERQC